MKGVILIGALSSYINTLVAAVVCVTIVEIILPSGNLKKYIVFICSVFLVIVVANPIVTAFNSDFDISKYFEDNLAAMQEFEYRSNISSFDDSVEKSYRTNLKNDIVTRLEENGYRVLDVNFEIDDDTFEPLQMSLVIEGKDGYVQPVIIDASSNVKDKLTLKQKDDVKKLLSEIYGVSKENVCIND